MGRFASPTAHRLIAVGGPNVGAVELAHPIFRQSGARPDDEGASLELDHAHRQLELSAFLFVTVVRESHLPLRGSIALPSSVTRGHVNMPAGCDPSLRL